VYTVNPEIETPGLLFFNLLFWKKLLNKNAINSHFSFFWPYKASEGVSISGFTVILKHIKNNYKHMKKCFALYNMKCICDRNLAE
jgi:hypothetical protein